MTSISNKRILIIGVGNILMQDEGIGVRVIEAMQSGYRLPDNIELLDGGTAGYSLIDCMEDFDQIVIVDAVRGGESPGKLYRLSPDGIASEKRLKMSGHKIELPEVLALGEKLGKLPKTTLIGIEPEDITWGMELSQTIKSALPAIIESVFEEIGLKEENFLPPKEGEQACA